MRYCPECGTEITDGAASFCPKCRKNITEKDAKKKKSSGGKYAKNKKDISRKEKTRKKKRAKTAKQKEKVIPEIVGEPVDDGYDGYYDDILPPDQDRIKEGIDKALVKKIVIVAVVVTLIISLCVAMLYGQYNDPEMIDADLVLVDEVSMLDVYLAEKLFRSVPATARLILVGDSDQLPSVGPGAVLKEIIASDMVPVVRLDQVFRQKNGSRIAANAKLIRHGNLSLEYGPDFEFYDSTDLSVSAEIIESLYLQETTRYGIDNVALLSPYRQKTETGVNALNQRLQGKVNPPASDKNDAVHGQRRFRTGDKVMQIKNCNEINNGDVGYVTSITGTQSDSVVRIDFGEGRVVDYENSDLDMLDLGYACTVHKSQGSEYKSVIINLQCAHSVMLVRPLIYTAITRAKERVLIVGERRALCTAIRRIDTEQRGTKLAKRIQDFSK